VNAEPTPVSYARIETAALDEKRRFAWKALLRSRDTAWAMSQENVEIVRPGDRGVRASGA
jgi:hypothetical protein